MKRQSSLLFLLSLVLVGGMAIVSCSKDDDHKDNKPSRAIVGAWYFDYREYLLVKERATEIAEAPNKKESYIPMKIRYYTSDGKVTAVTAYFDKDNNFKYSSWIEGTYTVEGNKLIEHFSNDDRDWDFEVKDGILTLSYYNNGGSLISYSFKSMNTKDLQQYFDNAKKDILGVWALDYDDYGYYVNDNNLEDLFKIYRSDGTVDLLTVYYNTGHTFKKSTIQHGEWSYDKFKFHEKIGDYVDDYLIAVNPDVLVEYNYDKNGNMYYFSYTKADIFYKLSDIQNYIDSAIEL